MKYLVTTPGKKLDIVIFTDEIKSIKMIESLLNECSIPYQGVSAIESPILFAHDPIYLDLLTGLTGQYCPVIIRN